MKTVTFNFPGDEFIRVKPGSLQSNLKSGEPEDEAYDAAVDGVETLLLALASEGVDLSTEKYRVAVETAIETIGNVHA